VPRSSVEVSAYCSKLTVWSSLTVWTLVLRLQYATRRVSQGLQHRPGQ